MAPKTILALAVGDPKHSRRIDHPGKLPEVRPYIAGLIHGLLDCDLDLAIRLGGFAAAIGLATPGDINYPRARGHRALPCQ